MFGFWNEKLDILYPLIFAQYYVFSYCDLKYRNFANSQNSGFVGFASCQQNI